MAIEVRTGPLILRSDRRWEVAGVALTGGSFLEVALNRGFIAGLLHETPHGSYVFEINETGELLPLWPGVQARIKIRYSN